MPEWAVDWLGRALVHVLLVDIEARGRGGDSAKYYYVHSLLLQRQRPAWCPPDVDNTTACCSPRPIHHLARPDWTDRTDCDICFCFCLPSRPVHHAVPRRRWRHGHTLSARIVTRLPLLLLLLLHCTADAHPRCVDLPFPTPPIHGRGGIGSGSVTGHYHRIHQPRLHGHRRPTRPAHICSLIPTTARLFPHHHIALTRRYGARPAQSGACARAR